MLLLTVYHDVDLPLLLYMLVAIVRMHDSEHVFNFEVAIMSFLVHNRTLLF